MLNFEEKAYLADFSKVTGLKTKIESYVDEITAGGIENIFLVGIGGTISLMYPMESFIKKHSKIPVYTENAAEIVLGVNCSLSEKSAVILYSESGTTKETVAAAEYCKSRGIPTIGVSGADNSPLANALKYPIVSSEGDYYSSDADYIRLYMIVSRLLYRLGDYPAYDAFLKALGDLPKALCDVKVKVDPAALKFATEYKDEPYHMLVGSGNMWGETYCYAMCILEEMQWIHTKAIHAAEFFHGTLELVDDKTSVILLKGEDQTRPLTDRVEKFVTRYTEKVTVFDTKDYALEGIPTQFRADFSPIVMTAILGRVSAHLEVVRNHSLALRRYYRKVEY
ncbi:MAG TPA: SIS domain-containing protein [Clostridia bacterium]|nr:SIS domain-containing protein [Clostridia bacterium]